MATGDALATEQPQSHIAFQHKTDRQTDRIEKQIVSQCQNDRQMPMGGGT